MNTRQNAVLTPGFHLLRLVFLAGLLPLSSQGADHPGDLDTTFGSGGKVTVHFSPYTGERSRGVFVQRDGKILLHGQSNYGSAIARFNSNGTLDNTFGSNGKLLPTDGVGGVVVLTTDEKLVMLGGSILDRQNFYVRRFRSNGTVDTGFGVGGKVATSMEEIPSVRDAVIQKDGKIVVVGTFGTGANQDFCAMRFSSSGSLDPSFGSGGRVRVELGKRDVCYSVALQPDGKILLAGNSQFNAYDSTFAVVRLTTNGILDTSFNGKGTVTTFFGFGSAGSSVAVQNDGKILLGGWGNLQCALARFNAYGTLDTSFGADRTGLVTKKVGSWDSWQKIAVQPDGKILAVGSTATFGQVIVARYNHDGSLDTSFGVNGTVLTKLGTQNSEATGLALQRDGKLLVSGTAWYTDNSYNDFALARYNNDGVAPPAIECPLPTTVDCNKPAQVKALIHNPSGLALVVVWTVNGQALQTNTVPAGNALNEITVSLEADLPLGINNVDVSVADALGNVKSCSTSVTVVDEIPPAILSCSASPDTLWPPNHKMVPVTVRVSSVDNCQIARCRIISVSNSEPPTHHGNGQNDPDWQITGDLTVNLRAERSGSMNRVYSIAVECADDSGNVSTAVAHVTVSHSMRRLTAIVPAPKIPGEPHGLVLTWDAIPLRTYRVQYTDDMSGTNWMNLPGDVLATGDSASKADTNCTSSQRYYRIVQMP